MGDYLRKVAAGQPLEIPAPAYNAFVDTVHAVRQMGQFGSASAVRGSLPPGLVYVRNDTGAAIAVHAVLGIGGAVYEPDNADPDTQETMAFRTQVVLKGVSPTTAHRGKFVVAAEPIGDGEIGRGFIAGACVLKINGADDSDLQFAEVTPGSTAHLTLSASGSAQVLMSERDFGVTTFPQWAIVRLGAKAVSLVRAVITDVHGFDGDDAGEVTYDVATEDGSIALTDVAPTFRVYGPEVPVSIALIDEVCWVDVTGDEPTLAFCTEKILTETCDGTLAYTFDSGANNGLNPEYLVIDVNGNPVVDVNGNLVLDYRASASETAAWALVVVADDGRIVFDVNGNPVIADGGGSLVDPDAFDLLVGDVNDDLVVDISNNAVYSPLTPLGVAEASPTSARSILAQAQAAVAVPIVTGSRGGNVALANLLSALNGLGIITNSTTA